MKIRSSQGHSQLQSKFKTSLHYLEPVLERKKKDQVGGKERRDSSRGFKDRIMKILGSEH